MSVHRGLENSKIIIKDENLNHKFDHINVEMETGKKYKEFIYQHWIHAHEEDQGSSLVFRPQAYDFPPSRGREEFILGEDNSCLFFDIASSDGRAKFNGKLIWDKDAIGVVVDYPGGRRRTFELISAETDKLVLKEIY